MTIRSDKDDLSHLRAHDFAAAIRRQFFRTASQLSQSTRDLIMPDPNGEDGDHPNERTGLLGDNRFAETIRQHHIFKPDNLHDERWWVRGPANTAYLTWRTLVSNPVNVFLVFVPLGIIAGIIGWPPVTIFVLNFLAIIPLASLLSFATEELSAKMGDTLGGLLNATFGNAVELIVSIVALKDGEIRIVQASMLGSMLSNMLLVLGCCFVAGGWRGGLQDFNETVASTMSSLLLVASASLIIPATLYAVMAKGAGADRGNAEDQVMILSRGTSIILLILYVLYLFFQLKSHADVFLAKPEDAQAREHRNRADSLIAPGRLEDGNAGFNHTVLESSPTDMQGEGLPKNDEDEEEHILGPVSSTVALVVVTVLVAWCAEYLVGSIDDIVAASGMSRTFIGLILLPIVGNAAEHVTAVVVSFKGKMDLALAVAVGSSMQIALLVTPALVILGWIIGQPMTLHFETFETVVFFLSVLVVNCESCLSLTLRHNILFRMYTMLNADDYRSHPGQPVQLPRGLHAARRVHHHRARLLHLPGRGQRRSSGDAGRPLQIQQLINILCNQIGVGPSKRGLFIFTR